MNFFEFVDKVCPPWTPPRTLPDELGRLLTDEKEDAGTRAVAACKPVKGTKPEIEMVEVVELDGKKLVERKVEFNPPFQRYLRGLDPAGNIMPITVTTCRGVGDDSTGFDSLAVSRKLAHGWLIAEPEYSYKGYAGKEYADYLAKQYTERRERHNAKQAAEELSYRSDQEKLLAEQIKSNQEVKEKESALLEKLVAMLSEKQGGKRA